MPGFGDGPFGSGAFGEWPWSLVTIVRAPPSVHRDQDDSVGDGVLQALLEGLAPSLDGLRRKIRDWDDLRDPLRCPAEDAFQRPVTILKSVDLENGTSQVFISQGADGDHLDGLRPGMVLIDFRSLRFTISEINTSARESDVDDAPVDPVTSQPIYKHIIVENIGQASTELIPFASGTAVYDENPADPLAFPNDPLNKDDGSNAAPYIFDLDPSGTYASPVEIARNRVELTWTEGSVVKSGFFTNQGLPGGDVDDNSTIDFDLGQIVLYNVGDGIIDADTIRVDYTTVDSPPPEDGEIRAQNILAYLAADYGIGLDRNDPTTLQRSYVYQAYNLWDIKGTKDSYAVLGEIAGYFVQATALNATTPEIAATLPSGSIFEFPAGSDEWYTTVNPGRGRFDEIAMDVIPLDLLCSDVVYPEVVQTINVDSVTLVRTEGSRSRTRLAISTSAMDQSYGTDGVLTDFGGGNFDIQSFERTSATTYEVEISSFGVPVTGAGTMTWKVLQFVAPNTITIGGDTTIEDRGFNSIGFTGKRYRLTRSPEFVEPPLSSVGQWAFIDSDGVVSYVESFTASTVSGDSQWEIVSETVPAAGTAHIFYKCDIVTTCDFCRASSLLIRISPTTILNFPEALEGDALDRLIIRLSQMIPAHVRIKAFLYDPGPATATWGTIAASSTILESWEDDALYSAFYDEDEFPADAIPTDSAPITASSEVTITNLNIFEEYLSGPDPIVAGTWTATGLWQVTQYRSSTQYRSFNYGQNDVGRLGDVGAVPPDYITGGATAGILSTPQIAGIGAASAIFLRFRHFADMRSGLVNDLTVVRVVEDTGSTTVVSFDKANLGLDGTGNTGGVFVTVTRDITASGIIGAGPFHLEFDFSSTIAQGSAAECWYIDDVEVQVTP